MLRIFPFYIQSTRAEKFYQPKKEAKMKRKDLLVLFGCILFCFEAKIAWAQMALDNPGQADKPKRSYYDP